MELIKTGLDAFIFNIQKYSVNDGPGIRTVVFLKGCPLRCKWCSNPESQSFRPQVLWNRYKCVNCHHCYDVCSINAITIKNSHISINHDRCNACGECVNDCLNQALEIKGKRMTVKEVLDIVLQDKVFYAEGGGGLTLSGGEFLSSPEFSIELLKAAKLSGINTCCESSGLCPSEKFREVIKYLDMMIFDVKHYDNDKHISKTGVPNTLSSINIKWALENKENVLIRIPIIPDFNETLEDARNFVPFLKELGVRKVQLLPFHQFGENKYKLLDKDYEYEDYPNMHKEDLNDYLKILVEGGIDAYL